jgi:RHS repeat-associated protein
MTSAGDQHDAEKVLDYFGARYMSSAQGRFTGKERDNETGLDYFGARYMSSAQGRWTSPDPSNLGVDIYLPQTWNRYNYGVNNPLAIADKNGLWPYYVHENIIDEAFPGMSKKDLQIVKDASTNMDYGPGQQDPSKSFMHGMSDGGGTVFWGGGNEEHDRIQADQFIDQQVQDAQKAQADWVAQGHTGISPKALTAFGNALHTVTDRTSPAHQGEQPWANKPKWHYTTIGHFLREAWRSPSQVQSSDNAARSLFLTTFGREFDWVFFKNPCARTSASDDQGNSTGWSGCQ